MASGTATATAKTVVPIGYRFLPTDEELILDYLANKVAGELVPSTAVVEADVYGTEPWNLLTNDDQEAYFFAVRKRKNSVGTRVDRRAGTGTWTLYSKKEEFVTVLEDDGREIAVGWIMHEYELYSVGGGGGFQTQVLCHIKNRAASGGKIKKRSREAANFPTTTPPKKACRLPTSVKFLEPSPTITCDCDADEALCDQVLASLAQVEEENFTTPEDYAVGHENGLWPWMQLQQGQASDLGRWEEELNQILLGDEFDL
ncbi:NAC domain-containing protein 68-like [Curcuma longa]|uniref:NAC domain-containing protein 68-like n=1 Tax=Curcuma longa TaxID=136217 RepID=UPI003D9F55A8